MAVAVDSNILWAELAGDRELSRRIAHAAPAILALPVLAEAQFAVLNSRQRELNQARLDRFLETSWVLAMGRETAAHHARIRYALARLGRVIPDNDIWIAAVCFEHNLPLATRDAHFEHVEGLHLLRW